MAKLRKKGWWSIGLAILMALTGYVFFRLHALGAFTNIPQTTSLKFEVLPVPPGPEDMEIDAEKGILYFISNDRWAIAQGNPVRGGIYQLDLKLPNALPQLINPDVPEDFHPHGLSLYKENDSVQTLMVINHRRDGRETVEIYDRKKDGAWEHQSTVEGKEIVSPNDMVAVGRRQFYLTNDSRSRDGLKRGTDIFFNRKTGNIVYFDGSKIRIVTTHLAFPNGINVDASRPLLYVGETIGGNLKVFERDTIDGQLQLQRSQFIKAGLDNIDVDASGDLWIGIQPNLLAVGNHLKNPQKTSPSQVLRLHRGIDRFYTEEIFSDDGTTFSGASVAVPYQNQLYIGAVCAAKMLVLDLDAGNNTNMRLSEWQAEGKYAELNGHRIFYAEAGTGEALLLLHAYPTASWGWHRMWPALSQRFHVIAPDLLGSGLSDKPKGGNYSVIYLADLVEELLAKLGIQKVHILAHAYGSSVAQELLARQTVTPNEQHIEIQSLCFVNGGIFPEVTKTTFMQKLLLTPVGSILAQNFPSPYTLFRNNFASTFGPHTKPSELEMQEFWDLLTYNEGHRRVPEVIQYLNERKQQRNRWVEGMIDTNIPIGLINGTTDELIGEATNQRWKELLSHAPLIILDGALGHYPPLEDPEVVLAAYFSFLEQIKASNASF